MKMPARPNLPAVPTTVKPLRAALKKRSPGLAEERALWDDGAEIVVGVDEVGRGAWAGPLTVGAVVVPRDRRIYKLRDSKQLTQDERESMFDRIVEWVDGWAIGHAWPEECDRLGMSAAQRLATRRALDALEFDIDAVLVDGNWDFVGHRRTRTLVKGDARSVSIAAASILAKVTRDRIMAAEAEHFPAYAFEDNKGYPCPRHQTALVGYGATSIHRRSWAFMDSNPWTAQPRVTPGGQEQLF